MTPEGLAQIWSSIETSPLPRELGWVRRQTNPGANVPVHAAVACVTRARSLMIDIPVSALGLLHELPTTGGLTVKLEARLDGVPVSQRTLLVELEDRQYEDIFEIFCAHLIDGLSECSKVVDATALLLARLARWQQFLQGAHDCLGTQAIIGLFGELWVLRDCLAPHVGIIALGSWTGAQKAPQDFIFPGVCALEVKTSAASQWGTVTIHGEKQLDESGLQRLFLVCLRLEVDNSGESLNQIVADLKNTAAAASEFATAFEASLAQAGWLSRHASHYDAMRFRVAEHRFFEVSDRFPRLTPASLSVGVDRIEYRLALKACVGHERTRAEVEQVLSSFQLSLSSSS